MPNTSSGSKGMGFIVILAIILVGCLVFTYTLYSKNEELKKTNADLNQQASSSDSILNQIAEEQKILSDSNATVVNMVGNKAPTKSTANVYWDSSSAAVYLVVKNMPELPS